jgi:hypothetical protein
MISFIPGNFCIIIIPVQIPRETSGFKAAKPSSYKYSRKKEKIETYKSCYAENSNKDR